MCDVFNISTVVELAVFGGYNILQQNSHIIASNSWFKISYIPSLNTIITSIHDNVKIKFSDVNLAAQEVINKDIFGLVNFVQNNYDPSDPMSLSKVTAEAVKVFNKLDSDVTFIMTDS
jgi:hypothetical protein